MREDTPNIVANYKRDPRCKLSFLEERRAIKLYERGQSLQSIANYFDCSIHCIWNVFKAHNFPLRSHGEGTRLLHYHISLKKPSDFPRNLANKFQKLLAIFLLTDGYLKRRSNAIMLISKDKVLPQYFCSLVKHRYGFAPTKKSFMAKNKETTIFGKKIIEELLSLSPSYNTYPRNKTKAEYFSSPQPTLSFLFGEDSSVLIEAIRIAMSCEGCVYLDKARSRYVPRLEFACSHPLLLEQWQRLFERVGIITTKLKSKRTWSGWRGLQIRRKDSIKRFVEIGGFVKGVKITGKSKYFAGKEKNWLLRKAMDESTAFLREAVKQANLKRFEKINALKRLNSLQRA